MNDKRYVSRGGLKLEAALATFNFEVNHLICCDLGCSTGGFTDCLLQHGAKQVYAVDTAYGQLDWKLRNDERVIVTERTNALHVQIPQACDLVVIDLGWTKQDKAIPAALRWVKPAGHLITLIKPHYESKQHRLTRDEAGAIAEQVIDGLPSLGVTVLGQMCSPIVGSKGGNAEWLALLQPCDTRNILQPCDN